MIVITLKNCPNALRGDLTLWLQEIATGVYVGDVSARIREELWQRVTKHSAVGEATLSYSIDNEQHYTFRTFQTARQVINCEGLDLVYIPQKPTNDLVKEGFSNAAKKQKAKQFKRLNQEKAAGNYTVIDVETTGLDFTKDQLLAIAALRVRQHAVVDQFKAYILTDVAISEEITQLTGLTSTFLLDNGRSIQQVLQDLRAFIATDERLVGHNLAFDLGFINLACEKCSIPPFANKTWDTLKLAKKQLKFLDNYRLETIANHYGIVSSTLHDALSDCELTQQILEHLLAGKK
ncbi:MAG: type I-E CRISPR-associated endoribonuclease Cas2e [Aerococcus sp.]|nr:type I-E CRISPR-associated endoribonuclease Cas2e [Aerococcus sp.]